MPLNNNNMMNSLNELQKIGALFSLIIVFTGAAAALDVSIEGSNSPVEAGDSLRVDVKVENNGGSFESENIRLKVDGDTKDTSYNVGVFSGDSATVDLSWDTEDSLDGQYNIEVSSETDSDSTSVTVNGNDNTNSGELRADITSTNSPVSRSDQISVSYRLENTDSEFRSDDTSLYIDGSKVSTHYNNGVFSRDTLTKTFEVDASNNNVGSHTVRVQTADDSDSATVRITSDSDDDPGSYSFDITFENSVNEGIENARVRVSGNSYDRTDYTDSRGEATFYNLVEGRNYDVEITCSTQGFNEIDVTGSITVDDRESFNEKTFSFPTQSDYCADSDDRDDDDDDHDDIGNDNPVARLDVSTVSSRSSYERLKFDASDSYDPDGRITKYEFDLDGDDFYDDRTIYSGGVVYRNFYSDFYDEVGVRVTDNDGGQDTTREDINVNVGDGDGGDERPRVDLISPTGSNVDTTPVYEWEITDDQDRMEEVTLVVDDDSRPFSNPVYEFDSDFDSVSTRANDPEIFIHSYSDELREDRKYYWAVEADDGETDPRRSHVESFRTGPRDDDDDETDERPRITLYEPFDGERNVDRRPRFEWRIRDDESRMNSAYLYVSRDRDVFDDYDYRESVDRSTGDRNDHNLDSRLREDTRYYWGIRADDDDYSATESRVFDFRTEGDYDREGSLEVTVRDDDGDRMDNARVEIRNGDFDSKRTSNGDARFYGLEPDTYEVTVFCEGRESEKDVRVSSGEDEETDIYLGFSSSDDYCGENDDEGDGRLTVNVDDDSGDDLDALVRVDGRERYTGNDGRVVFDDLPRENLQVRVSKSGYETEYDNVDLEDDRVQTIFFTLDRDEEDERPEADFDYSPLSPEVDERVSFDGGLSRGDIVDYQWNFGDGDRSAGRQVTHRYGDSGTYPVRLTVREDDGDQYTRIKYVSVGSAQEECGISDDSFYFSLDEYTIEEGESTQAELQIYNTGSEDQEVDVEIKVDGGTVRDRTVNVPVGSSRTVTARVSPDRDSFVTAEMSTSGGSCGFKDFDSLTRELIVLQYSDEEEASLDVRVDSEDGYVRNARVEVEGPEDRVRYTDRYGEAGFSLEAGRYDVEVSHPRYETEDDSIRLREGDREELRFNLDREDEDDEDGTLDVNVIDREGDDIEDARVRVENGDRRIEYTDSRGEARFSLEADDYDIEVTHPDYDDTARSSVEIEEDEFHSRTLRLYDEERDRRDRRGLEIVSTDYPSSVCRGDTLSVDYRVRNYERFDESAQTTASGLGGIIVTNTYVIDSGESVSGTLRFTNVEGSGREEFSIRVRNGTSDRVTRTVDVRDCGPSERPQEPTSATSVSMKLSYPISPNRALVGDTVKVSGFVDGVNRRTQVRIDVDGDEKARVSTQPDGYYQTYIRVDSPGMKTVRARSAGESASRQIEVLPTGTVSSIEAPRSVFEGESFEVCSRVDSQIQAGVFFYEDGRLIERENTRGETCFEVTADEPGTHSYEVRAATPGTSSSSTVSVEVMETEVQTRSFPDQIASVESGSGMVKVDLYNSNNEMTRYDLTLEGLPRTWLSQSTKQVILSPGESETVYFYLTPREEGSYNPEIVVEADNSEVYRQEVDLETGGQNEPREKSFLDAFRDFFL